MVPAESLAATAAPPAVPASSPVMTAAQAPAAAPEPTPATAPPAARVPVRTTSTTKPPLSRPGAPSTGSCPHDAGCRSDQRHTRAAAPRLTHKRGISDVSAEAAASTAPAAAPAATTAAASVPAPALKPVLARRIRPRTDTAAAAPTVVTAGEGTIALAVATCRGMSAQHKPAQKRRVRRPWKSRCSRERRR
jgi:hypothetical protein